MASIPLTENDDVYAALNSGDRIFGLGGNDVLTAHFGGSELYGGDGDDTLSGSSGGDVLQGDDTNNSDGLNVLNGFGGDDFILSNSHRDKVNAGGGNDTVEVWDLGAGQIVQGGVGEDQLSIMGLQTQTGIVLDFSSSFTITKGATDLATYKDFESLLFVGGQFRYNVSASAKADTLILNNQNSITFLAGSLDGRGGGDQINVSGVTSDAVQQVDGGTGNDQLRWSQGSSSITDLTVGGGSMSDEDGEFLAFQSIERLVVNAGNILGHFNFTGLAGADTVSFSGLTAFINSAGGDDSIGVGSGTATVQAGAGNDSISTVTNAAALVNISCGSGDDVVTNGSGGTISGGAGADQLSTVYNGASLFGGADNDALTRQASFIDTASSSAIIDGGGGIDTLTIKFNIVGTAITADFSRASTTLYDGSRILGCEIVNYTGGYGVDRITSSAHNLGASVNIVQGGSGNDILKAANAGATLDGGYGDDKLTGGAGNDILSGGFGGNDTLTGGAGDDQMTGSSGKDSMRGGLGADHFAYAYWGDSGTTALTRDVILDFRRDQGDKIDLSGIDAINATVGVNDGFTFAGSAFSNAAGQLIFQKFDNAGTADDYTLVSGDITGGGAANFTIEVNGLVNFTAGDFIL
ncbi:beta strand repeat-containing protein [Aestuariivirga sp.]|uniref:beta strand repeat-containing protein n=1 Tax=Aestuariivirga sp. TaxID=2650926 RepID=UPI003593DAE4